jgi:murein DD-endopeptidase MepM/ murein hydrolase activator NlpD
VRLAIPPGGCLDDAVAAAGERPALAGLLADVLAWEMDPYAATAGTIQAVVEEDRSGGKPVRYGRVLSLRYEGPAGRLVAVRGGEGRESSLRRPDGRPLALGLARSPLRHARLDPADRAELASLPWAERPKPGRSKDERSAPPAIDFLAPKGMPVAALAAGKVLSARAGGGRFTVVVEHGEVEVTYGNLGRLARGLKKGLAVRPRQVLGTLGPAMHRRGPHLHLEVRVGGKPVAALPALAAAPAAGRPAPAP